MGCPLSRHHPVVGERLERVRVPFLDYDVEIRRVICSTNAIESINARYRRAIPAAISRPNKLPSNSSPGDPFARSDGPRYGRMDDEVEAGAQCVCDHLRRPDHPDRQLTDAKVRSAVNRTAPNFAETPDRPVDLQ
jgi:hypothetical protein